MGWLAGCGVSHGIDAGGDAATDAGSPVDSFVPPMPDAYVPPELGPTLARYPWNGFRAPAPPASDADTFPVRFVWDPAPGATHYELQLDDSCAIESYAECDFASPEIALTIEENDVRIAVAKEHAGTAPQGRRFYWRVRSCDDVECTGWTTPRYLHLGRARDDFNGDGYTDLPLGFDQVSRFPTSEDRRMQVWWGASDGLSSERMQLLSYEDADVIPIFSVPVGDFDGDGYDDLLVIADQQRSDWTRSYLGALLYRGSEAGLVSAGLFAEPDPSDPEFRGYPPIPLGDLDGDGCDDLLDPDSRFILFGTREAVADVVPLAGFPPFTRPRGPRPSDLNGDGFLDLTWIVESAGELALLSGTTSRLGGVRLIPILWEGRPGQHNPFRELAVSLSALHDADDDGYGDLLALGSSQIYVLRGQRELPAAFDARSSVEAPYRGNGGPYSGDPDGDGHPNLATRSLIYLIDGSRQPRIEVLRAPTLPDAAVQTVGEARDYAPEETSQVSEMRDYDGDGYDDQLWLVTSPGQYHLLFFSGSSHGLSWAPTRVFASFSRDQASLPALPEWTSQ